ncbi:MAG: ATP-binding cassette domain-containing protein [Erysipelotrichaceae bacterium]|nr:ATP-binding cassette domain-containing protein [Erysipelotrichaceae bacterium]MBR2745293.1 ATP-binding cassette domain-containing protein [Erysipelotrichaceae bacterium]
MLTINNITKTFNLSTPDERKALDDFSLSVKPGEFVTLIGANGAGKSTLFNAICGNFITDSGSIILDGHDITLMPQYERSRNIGRLYQDPTLGTAPGMTIEENLALATKTGRWITHITNRDRELFRQKLSRLQMHLEDRLTQQIGSLSGGQRQAMALLMATINPPKLLLLDEHTAALDPEAEKKVMRITEEIVREHDLTCIMITHDMQAALDMGTRTIMMHDGKIIYDVYGEERKKVTVNLLLEKFRQATGKDLNNDRMLMI